MTNGICINSVKICRCKRIIIIIYATIFDLTSWGGGGVVTLLVLCNKNNNHSSLKQMHEPHLSLFYLMKFPHSASTGSFSLPFVSLQFCTEMNVDNECRYFTF